MKKLIILRHGKSSWDDITLDDFDRPLNERGTRNAAQMGRFILKKSGMPDLILSSSANRALQTATLAAESMDYPLEKIETDRSLYLAWTDDILKRLSSIPNEINYCILVGHNPGLTDFINLLGVNLDNLPTASAACFELDIKHWKKISGKKAHFQWLQLAREIDR